jgi:hypothetical protein
LALAMTLTRTSLIFRIALVLFAGCAVSDRGLGPTLDAAPATGTVQCPSSLTDNAPWPAGTTYTACSQRCGPEQLGVRACGQSDSNTCQASPDCVCLDPRWPCVKCASCAFLSLSECYIPTNVAAPPTCPDSVVEGGPCTTACDRQLCIERDGRTGCMCNDRGKYACAAWNETAWK